MNFGKKASDYFKISVEEQPIFTFWPGAETKSIKCMIGIVWRGKGVEDQEKALSQQVKSGLLAKPGDLMATMGLG